jgi:membrane protease YdiL (CAAX protease family)
MHSTISPHAKILPLAIVFEGGLGLAAIAVGWLVGQSPAARIGWSSSAVAIGSAASLPLLLALVAMSHSRAVWCVRLQQVAEEMIVPLFERSGVLDLAVISLFAGVGEELLFRGLIQPVLGEWFSPTVGLIGASLLFGLAHPLTTGYAVVTALAGLYLGSLFLATDNLLVPIVTHAVYDFLALWYLVRRPRAAAAQQPD